ncbi:MAG: hypothetical protein QGI88_03710, partial [SAR202 cluster bacterium]|nr:hypothetical protein [SAR202 cluster bacterium]
MQQDRDLHGHRRHNGNEQPGPTFLAEFHDVSRGEISPYLYELTDTEAVRHVLNVTSGMDSLVLGEPQILGQVRDA